MWKLILGYYDGMGVWGFLNPDREVERLFVENRHSTDHYSTKHVRTTIQTMSTLAGYSSSLYSL